jgi:hypothetical protein
MKENLLLFVVSTMTSKKFVPDSNADWYLKIIMISKKVTRSKPSSGRSSKIEISDGR